MPTPLNTNLAQKTLKQGGILKVKMNKEAFFGLFGNKNVVEGFLAMIDDRLYFHGPDGKVERLRRGNDYEFLEVVDFGNTEK